MRAFFNTFVTLLIYTTTLFAQEELGFHNSNYAGVNSLFLNPSFNVDSKIFIDVHLIGMDVFAHNNVTYQSRNEFAPLFGKFGSTFFIDETNETKKAFSKLELIGPSIAVSWKKHSFGLFTRFRNYLSAEMTPSLFVMALNGFNYQSYVGKQLSEKASLAELSWAEIGLSYGHMFKWSSFSTLNVGINVKYLSAVSSLAMNIGQFDFTPQGSKNLDVVYIEGGYKMADPGINIGSGFGVDIGVNYQKKLENITVYEPNSIEGGCKHVDYKYKVGLSLLDLGYVNISKKAILKEFVYRSQNLNFDTAKVNGPSGINDLVNTNLKNNSVQQVTDNSYMSLLPFGISAQVDYNFENNFYLNFTSMTSFQIPYHVKRPDLVSVALRYERKYFEVAVPFSLIGYTYPQLGLAVRLGQNLIIGTDRLDSMFGKLRDVYGADLYFHLKFAFFRKCGNGGSDGSGFKKKPKARKCAAYS